LDQVDDKALPRRQRYTTQGATFPKYRRYDAGDTDTVLILLHRSGLDSRSLQPMATALSNAGVAHVVTPDLRGHGSEPERRGDVDYLGQLRDDLRYLIRSVEKIYPDATVVVGGHGDGGGLAVRFASTPYGSLADAYLLLAPHLGLGASTTRPAVGGWANYYMDRIIMLRICTGFGFTGYNHMTVVEFDMPESVRDGNETVSYTYRLMASYLPDDEDDATEMVEVPYLTLVGSDDETAYPDRYEPLFSDYEDATTEILDGISHLDLVLDPVVDWLAERSD
jgi:pimeloyl-ACP methyl ester carboxylesterase